MYKKKYPLYGVVCVWVRFICGSAGSGLADRSGTDCMSDGDGYSGGAGGAGSESHAAAAAVSAAAAASEALVTAQLTATWPGACSSLAGRPPREITWILPSDCQGWFDVGRDPTT